MKSLRYILFVCLSLSFFSCDEKVTDNLLSNKQPKTYLWLFPDSTVGIGVSRQQLRWWGEDPDGVVRGYLFGFVAAKVVRAPDTLKYTWVTKNDTLMQFPLDTLFRNYTVFVRSVDNTFQGLANQTLVRLSPSPYADNNANGVFDGGDQQLATLSGAMDPVGALLTFPIRNTKPTIAFAQNPNDPANPLRLPDSTYTVVSIGFKGADADGDNTLAGYRIALNDTANVNWLNIPLRDTVVTLVVPRARSDAAPPVNGVTVAADVYGGAFLGRQLVGQVNGLRLNATNVIYVQAKDVAGEFSPTIRLPSATQQWYVKRPRGRLLLVQDYTRNDAQLAVTTYLSSLAVVPDTQVTKVDLLNLSFGVTAVDKRAGRLSTNVPPYIDPALINTFLLYDYVFLYTDEYASIKVLQLAPFPYLQNGGKMLFSTMYTPDFADFNINSVFREFAPIDSVCSAILPPATSVPGARLIPANYVVFGDSSVPNNVYPQLAFNSSPSSHIFYMREAYKRTDGRIIYRLQQQPQRTYRSVDPTGGADTLRPKVAIVDGEGKIIFFGLPLHLLNNTVQGNPQGLGAFFIKAFTQHFSRFQKVDRKKF